MPGDAAPAALDLAAELSLGLELADVADAITLGRFRATDLRVDTKPDLTPVSDADRAVEAAIREVLATARPADAVLGEEEGLAGAGAGVSADARRWIVDPIDGTKSYVRGIPAWATLIALEVAGEVVVGVASAPALGRRWWAARGAGAFANGERIRVSAVAALEDAYVSGPDRREFAAAGLAAGEQAVTQRCWRSVGLGDFWGHVLVAEGALDVMVEPSLSLWDVAALRPIVDEAGGRLSDLSGEGWHDGAPCVTTNGRLHDLVLAAYRGAGPHADEGSSRARS